MFDALMNKEIVPRTDIEWDELLGIQPSQNIGVEGSVEPDQ